MVGGLYEIRHLATGRRYVGSTQDFVERFGEHRCLLNKGRHHNVHLQRAWMKYGAEAFVLRVLAILEPEAQVPAEQRLLNQLHPVGCLYNVALDALSPMRGRTLSAETRQKIRDHLALPATKAAVSVGIRAAWRKPEVRQKYIAAAHAVWANPEARQRMSTMKRALMADPARRARMSAAQIKACSDPAVRERIAAGKRGQRPSAETRAKRSVSMKATLATLSAEERAKRYANPELRAKRAEIQRRVMSDPAMRERLAAANRGKRYSPETCAKKSASMKATLLAKRIATAAAATVRLA